MVRHPDLAFLFVAVLVSAGILAVTSHADADLRLPAAAYNAYFPVWSPDGRYLAFTREAVDVGDSVAVVSVESGRQRWLAAGTSASWSPDGTRIVYQGGFDILSIGLDGTGPRQVATGGSFPLWSPDGRSVLFARSGLYVVSAVGGRALRLAADVEPGEAAWSPDGTRILFQTASGVPGAPSRITVVGRNGSGLRVLGSGEDPTFAPDGRRIAFTARDRSGAERVCLMRRDGSDVRMLTPGLGPVVSPDGKRIAFRRRGERAIWVVNRDGSDPRPVTRPPSARDRDFGPAWSPDGRTLAFVREGRFGTARIWLVDRDGNHARQLTSEGPPLSPVVLGQRSAAGAPR